MKQRRFHATATEVSEIGLGCWQFGGEWGPMNRTEVFRVLETACAKGVTFFDTADVYGKGLSEELLGRFLRETGSDAFVATKFGRFPEPGWPQNFTPATIRQHVEASLRRLQRDTLDLVQLHCLPKEQLLGSAVFETLSLLREEGKIRSFGASVETMEEALICLKHQDLASLQIIFNLFRQKPIKALFDIAEVRKVSVIVRLPLASGLLAGRYDTQTKFDAADHRSFNRDGQAFNVGETFAGLPFERGLKLVDLLRRFVPEGWTMAQFAQRWILDHAAVTTIITGASRAEQVAENSAVSALPALPQHVHAALSELYDAEVHAQVRGGY